MVLSARSADPKLIPFLETWAQIDYKKAVQRIRRVIGQLEQSAD